MQESSQKLTPSTAPPGDIQVVILCGGEGTRLREETQNTPKPLLPIGTDPILLHIMRIYAGYGFRRFILCLGYRGSMIKDFFLDFDVRSRDMKLNLATGEKQFLTDGLGTDWDVVFAETGTKTQTGARLARIAKYIDGEEFLCTYGDGVCDVDLAALVAFHRAHGRLATMTGIETHSPFGLVRTDGSQVIGFSEKPKVPGLINGGYFVFNRRVFDYLSEQPDCILEREPLEGLTRDGQLQVYRHSGFWQCMDTFKDYQLLNAMWEQGSAPWTVRG